MGAKQNKIEFLYHNIKFTKQTKGKSLLDIYKKIIECWDFIKFDIIGRFSIDIRNGKTAQVIIEDFIFEKGEMIGAFGL